MRRILGIFLLAVFVSVGAGCATKSSFEPTSGAVQLPKTATYEVADITDESGFTPSGEDLDPKQAMRTALEAALTKANLLGTEYKLKIEISEYEPGNAFARWVLPGLGGTYLKTRTYVQNADNGTVATIPVNRTVAAGGAFTIGAWRECFNEVAEEIVKILKQEMGLLPKKSKTSADS